jgi:hypothetical protein
MGHSAFEHLVGDGSRHLVEECGPHLRIVAHELYGFLLPLGLCFAFLLPQLLARCLLILLDHLVGHHLHERVLLCGGATRQQHNAQQCQQGSVSDHRSLLSAVMMG